MIASWYNNNTRVRQGLHGYRCSSALSRPRRLATTARQTGEPTLTSRDDIYIYMYILGWVGLCLILDTQWLPTKNRKITHGRQKRQQLFGGSTISFIPSLLRKLHHLTEGIKKDKICCTVLLKYYTMIKATKQKKKKRTRKQKKKKKKTKDKKR